MKAAGLLPAEPFAARVSRLMAWLAGALILSCGLLISVDVLTRLAVGRGVVESFELSGYLLACATGLALGFTVTAKANIRVDVALERLPWRLRALCDVAGALALAAVALALAVWCWRTLALSWSIDARSTSRLQTPFWAPQGVWWFGIAWFAGVAVAAPLLAVLRLLRGDRAGVDALVGPRSLADEIGDATASTAERRR